MPLRKEVPLPRSRDICEGVDGGNVVVYWMLRELRTEYNFSLERAQEEAKKRNCPMVVLFSPYHSPYPNMRQLDWRVRGLVDVYNALQELNIPLICEKGSNWPILRALIDSGNVATMIVDHFPLLEIGEMKAELLKLTKNKVRVIEVDAHNVVPTWFASDKHEFRAYLFREKLATAMEKYTLASLPSAPEIQKWPYDDLWVNSLPTVFSSILRSKEDVLGMLTLPNIPAISHDPDVKPVKNIVPGQVEGIRRLDAWCSTGLKGYDKKRNDPLSHATSKLSFFYNHGFISPHYALYRVSTSGAPKEDRDSYIDEALTWRELSDNFTFYVPGEYKTPLCWPNWVHITTKEHDKDERAVIYSQLDLEQANTYDELWNVAQKELVMSGKIHGFLRMYWSKKTLEWTNSAKEALAICLYLNDKWSLDGTDPNSYNGIMWSIGGIHDRAFMERPIYGKLRYLSTEGAQRKFDTKQWISKIEAQWEAFQKNAPVSKKRVSVQTSLSEYAKPKRRRSDNIMNEE